MSTNISGFDKHYNIGRKLYSDYVLESSVILPSEVAQLFANYGLSNFENGFLWLVDPSSFQALYAPWFKLALGDEDSIDLEKTYPFMRTAFGGVFYFNEDELGYISVVTNSRNNLNMNYYLNKTLIENESLNDIYFYDLFQIALERFGELESDECYAFLPPLALGGEIDEANLQKVKLREHLALLSSLLED